MTLRMNKLLDKRPTSVTVKPFKGISLTTFLYPYGIDILT